MALKKPKQKIPLFKVFMSPKAGEKVIDVLNSGFIGQGPKVEEFEIALKEYFDHPYIQTVNAGTSALHMALHLLKKPQEHIEDVFQGIAYVRHNWPGLKPGDEVLCTAMTCTASNWPVLANGLKIKWVDIDPKTLNIDLADLENKITEKTKVIMGVHWGGYPLDLDKIKDIQNRSRKKLGWAPALIEDGAHSFGSEYKGKPIGTNGNLTIKTMLRIMMKI